ncbi:MAG: ChaN family lipoprotein [Blastocatellia bacterium]
MNIIWRLALFLMIAFSCVAGGRAFAQVSPHSGSGYTPQRVYDSGGKRFSDFEAMLADLARHDVVFVGEQHDDPATHRLERAILEGLARRRANLIVAMEMFERDVQQTLSDYLAGRLSEEEFLKGSRPWPRYATDYRSLVEMARAHKWPVIASNTPRRIASQVSRKGLEAAQSLPETERNLIAAELKCPMDEYFKRFSEVMSQNHPGQDGKAAENKNPDPKQEGEQKAMVERFYYAQCVKDETMAESIANQFNSNDPAPPRPLVVHFNGAFHSDYRLGTAGRVIRRMPKSKLKVVSIVLLEDLDSIKVEDYRKRGDYILFTLKPPAAKKENAN